VTVGAWVDVAALGRVLGISLLCGVGLVALYALGLVGLSIAGVGGGRKPAGFALAAACFLAVTGAVALGLWTIVA
jgi:hypothetical protein